MHKVIKIFSKLILSAILLAIIVPLTLSVLLTISVVQNRVVECATSWASEYLDARVDIANIQVGSLGRLRFEGVYVEDMERDTLLYAKRLNVHIQSLGIASREIRFGEVSLFGGELNLRQMKDSVLNIKHIVDRITPQTPAKKKMRLNFERVNLSDFDLRLERLEHRNPKYGVDYGDMELLGMTAEVEQLLIEGSDVGATIREFSAVERSGFDISSLRGEFYLTVGSIELRDAILESRYSYLNLPYIKISAPSWADYKTFVESVDMQVQVKNSTLLSDDVSYFAPALRSWGITMSELDVKGSGRVNDLSVDITHSRFEESSSLALSLNILGLPNVKEGLFRAHIVECMTTPTDINRLYYAMTSKELPEGSRSIVEKLGELRYNGGFEGTMSDFMANFDATSSLGVVKSTFQMENFGLEGHILSGEVATTDFDLGRLFETKDVGRISFTSTIEGDVNSLEESALAYGTISNVELRGESYQDIKYSTEVNGGDLFAEMQSQNKGLDFSLSATVDINQQGGGHEISLELNEIDLVRLGVNRRDSISQISAQIDASLQGRTIEDMVGDVVIQHGGYIFGNKHIISEVVNLHMHNDAEGKYFELSSDFADVIYRSKSSYKESWEYLRGSMRDFLPALYATPLTKKDSVDDTEGRYSMLSVEVKEIDLLSEALVEGLQIARGSRADLMYDISSRALSFSLSSQYLELNSTLALDINLDANNSSDSIAISGSVKELLVGTRQFDDLTLRGGAHDNIVRVDVGYSDLESSAAANLDIVAELSYTPEMGRSAVVRLLPSQISQGNQRWDIGAQDISISRRGVSIDHFRIRNEEQELLIDGLASKSESDTLRVLMRNFDLSILSSVTKAIGYSVDGFTSGDVTASSALYNMRVEANIAIDSASLNSIPSPPLRLLAQWDASRNRADISLRDRIKRDTLIRGYYIPSEAKYYARIEIDSLNLGLLDAPLKGVLTNTSGYADARLEVNGVRRQASLEGEVEVRELRTRVGYTNVVYGLPHAKLDVRNNELICRDVAIYDTLNNRGHLDLTLSLKHLSNISYGVRLSVEDILALDTTPRDNDLFYGKIFTSGVVDIVGNRAGVNMDITARTAQNSEFYLPLSNKSDISTAEFIRFVAPQNIIDTTDVLQRKRLMFESQRQRRERIGGSNLNINMALAVTPAAAFQLVIDPTVGDVIRGRGEGQLNLKINPQSNTFDMYGDYTISEGSYLFTLRNIINKRFIINPGSTIQWSGNPLDANLNIEAVYKLKTSLQPLMQDESTRAVPVDCSIFLSGQLMRPDVAFDISLPTADPEQQAVVSNLLNDQEAISRQFFYLMLANSFISEVATGTGAEFGVNTTAATGFELLTNQLSNWLSSSNYNVVIRYRPESELAGDELDLGISRSLINNRLLVEIEGNYTNDTSTVGDDEESISNFTGEAYITWLIDRSGALRLRGFTQTIDRFDENQGLQETGVGIYYRESFNNFRDLQQRVKARFSRGGVSVKDKEKKSRKNRKIEEKIEEKDDD